jgi:hypothetical protein
LWQNREILDSVSNNFYVSNTIVALVILSRLWQNTPMPRWLPILMAAILGLILGLAYGWVINPVQYTDITPEALRIDYRTDYVLMVAEAYRAEQDPALAARRLAVLGSQPPALLAEEAYSFAQQSAYPVDDLTLIQDLDVALQAWQPIPGTSLP